jgi:peptide/nickel transport system permease protein
VGGRQLAADRVLVSAVAVLAVMILLALFGGIVWRQSPLTVNVGNALQPPSWSHPFGTDSVGRDVLARFIEGARISLAVGAIVVVCSTAAGTAIGLLAGMRGGIVDGFLMRVMDALLAFPALILAMLVTVGLGVGLVTSALGITLAAIPYCARLVRVEVLRVRSSPLVEATVALGATERRVVLRHIFPDVTSVLLVQGSTLLGSAILTLAALGFIGLGAQVPTPEWGAMITDGLQYTLTGQWWISVFPGLGVLVTATAACVLADRLRDRLDPALVAAPVSG